MSAENECYEDFSDEYYDHYAECPECSGEGVRLVCIDDLCHGLGYCIHGDGMIVCEHCAGVGYIEKGGEE